MTLLLAAIEDAKIWMIADTAITGELLGPRERVDHLKIVRIGAAALAGFADDEQSGTEILDGLRQVAQGEEAVRWIVDYQGRNAASQVSIAYGWFAGTQPHLVRIAAARVEHLNVLHIGDTNAFARLQAIRHASEADPPPAAISLWMHYSEGPSGSVPPGMAGAIQAMQKLFSHTDDRAVGGVVVPYLIDGIEARRCGYTHSVTDPGCMSLVPGDVIEHGTAERGGFGVSVYELAEHDGISIYWLQGHAGCVITGFGKESHVRRFSGSPLEFVLNVKTKLGRDVHVGFGCAPLSTDKAVSVMRDEKGRALMAITTSREGAAFAWIGGPSGPFRSSHLVPTYRSIAPPEEGMRMAEHRIAFTLEEDRSIASIEIEGPSGHVQISASAMELDRLIEALSMIRSGLHESVPLDLSEGTKLTAVEDPAWRTHSQFAAHAKGVTLVLRHPGLNWRAFLLPVHEALALGSTLVRTVEAMTGDNANKGGPTDSPSTALRQSTPATSTSRFGRRRVFSVISALFRRVRSRLRLLRDQ